MVPTFYYNYATIQLDLSFNYSGACYQPPILIGCQLDRFDLAGLKR